MSRKTNAGRRGRASGPKRKLDLYLDSTRQPLHCLVFLVILLAAYEFGALMLRPGFAATPSLVAANLIESFLAWVGPAGSWAPALVLVLTLVAWHVLSRRPAVVHAWVIPLMAAESALLTLPLFVLGGLFAGGTLQADSLVDPAAANARNAQLVLVIGAGIYEEFVFRLVLISLLLALLVDLGRMRESAATIIAAVLSSLVFAACHYHPIGSDAFDVRSFLMRTLAGGYLAAVYVSRGVGVSAGTHVAYNVISLLLRG